MAVIERRWHGDGTGKLVAFVPESKLEAMTTAATMYREQGDALRSQLRGAVGERDRYRKQAQRFRTIMASASELDPADCRRLIRDALRGHGECPCEHLRDQLRAADEVTERLRCQLAGAVERAEKAEALLKRLSEWDHMQTAGDGPYWRREIADLLGGSST